MSDNCRRSYALRHRGSRTPACHMSGALSILIFAGLLTVVAIDHPFAGSVKVRPDALAAVIADFGDWTPR